jgi:ubiquitin carboxyl-terminal hydrolase 25/28
MRYTDRDLEESLNYINAGWEPTSLRFWNEWTDNDFLEITDYHSAFRFLEPAYDESNQYPDDYVIALAGVKKAERDETSWQEKVAKAVRVIANERHSDVLHAYLTTGEAATTLDDDELTAAYRFYDIQDRTSELNIDVLETWRDSIIEDLNISTERKVRATQYFQLLKDHHKAAPPIAVMADYTKPVGLENTRNFCYLHALLQYFFSIKPFRDAILNFDNYKQPIETAKTTDLGKVGGATITASHVEDGQKLVPYLAKLFKSLRSTAASDIIIPAGLAAEALNAPPSALIATSESGESGGDVAKNDDASRNTEGSPNPDTVRGDESSDTTLVGDVIMTPGSETDEQQTTDPDNDVVVGAPPRDDDEKKDGDGDKSSPPSRPPPVPPRPAQLPKADEIANEYRQHDAHEVAGNVIQRTIAAIKPTSIDSDGERHDTIRDLFYGHYQQYCTEHSKKKIEFSSVYDTYQYLHLQRKPKDVQEGLDITFGRVTDDADNSDEAWQAYNVIKQAPPLLQLYLQNREFDATPGELKSARVIHHMQLNESINLSRYMEGSSMVPLREQAHDLRDQIETLEVDKAGVRTKIYKDKTKDLDIDEALSAIHGVMKSDAEDETLDQEDAALKEDVDKVAEEEAKTKEAKQAEALALRAKLDAMDLSESDTDDYRYRIFAIFMYV